jgi:acetyl-CoA carboxylase biotin carboxyl carrier protein
MELKDIQSLIKFVSTSGVDEVSIERKDFKLSIKKANRTSEVITVHQTAPVQQTAVASLPQAPAPVATPAPAPAPAAVASNLVEIKSPMIGTFYRSSSPDKPAFVNVGDEVSVGQVICIVEAMKLFNEIESEISGKIVKVLVDDASPVEYDQPLYLVEV